MFDALIFDCDGVLVDSEVLAQEVELAALASIGLDYPRNEFTQRFTGTSAEDMNAAITQDYHTRFGKPIAAGFFAELDQAIHQAYAQHLQPIAGAAELVSAWVGPKAVASSSSAALVALKLQTAGLADMFYPHVFTADHARAKPHPDLFIMAADALDTERGRCVVVEDSVNGVTAAKRAGMQVIGFTGGTHCQASHADTLRQSGAGWVFSNFSQVSEFLLRD